MLPALLLALVADFPRFEAQQIDPHAGEVVYAVTVADVDGDAKPDVVAITEDSVLWYQNPSWEKHLILRGQTARDNVCIQPHDIDGDGRVDFALGAGWKPSDTSKASTLQWLGRDAKGGWQVHPIAFTEPTLHRLRWGDVLGNGKAQLVVAPLQGRGTKGPDWGVGQGVKIQVFSIPDDPTRPDWPVEIADESLHTTHNLQVTSTVSGRPAGQILIAGWEGVFLLSRSESGRWSRSRIGSGNQDTSPSKGSSEVKLGRMRNGWPYAATIEPWHGFQAVVYTPALMTDGTTPLGHPKDGLWHRTVVAEPMAWGHAIWCADLDGDGDDELIVGQRDPNKEGAPKGPGIYVFDPKMTPDGPATLGFTRHTIDDGGMACEDALAADLDGDGRPEIIAGGRASHNVKIYWNNKP